MSLCYSINKRGFPNLFVRMRGRKSNSKFGEREILQTAGFCLPQPSSGTPPTKTDKLHKMPFCTGRFYTTACPANSRPLLCSPNIYTMRYSEIGKEMSSLYFGLVVFCLFEARVSKFDMQPPPFRVHCTLTTVLIYE